MFVFLARGLMGGQGKGLLEEGMHEGGEVEDEDVRGGGCGRRGE